MKDKLISVVSSALILLALIASGSQVGEVGTQAGKLVPNITLSNNTQSMQLQDLRGSYVVLDLWSSTNPDSRIACQQHERMAHASSRLEHVAVNFDPNAQVWQQVVEADGMRADRQFSAGSNQEAARLRPAGGGYASVLIAPDGTVVAVNPTAEQLQALG